MIFLKATQSTLKKTYTQAGRAFSFLSLEVRGIQAAAYILAVSSFLSSLLALVRDRILAGQFGAGMELDIYYAAFRIPDMVFIGIGALVSAYMLIPELARRDEAAQRSYIDTVLIGFSVLAILVSITAALLAPTLLPYFFPALSGQLDILILTSRILLLQAALLGLSNIAAAITQFRHRYALYACSPIVYNLGIIFGALALYPYLGIPGLAWGVVAGAALHLGIQLPSIFADGFLRHIPRFSDGAALFDTIRVSLPRALALSMNQISLLGLFALAGTLASGSISVFTFAYNMQNVPLGIIGASYATAAFPTLAYAFSRGESQEYLSYVALAARQILFWSFPVMAIMVVLRAHIVRAVLGSGAFDWTDTRLTAAALAILAIALAANGLSLLLIRAFYACGRTFVPFIASALTAGLVILFGKLFLIHIAEPDAFVLIESFLRVRDVAGTEVLALAMAFALATLIGTCVLIVCFEGVIGTFAAHIAHTLWESLVAAIAGGAAAYVALNVIGDITFSSTLASVLLKATAAGAAGLIAAALAYYLLGSREFFENVESLRKRLWRGIEPVTSAEETHSA